MEICNITIIIQIEEACPARLLHGSSPGSKKTTHNQKESKIREVKWHEKLYLRSILADGGSFKIPGTGDSCCQYNSMCGKEIFQPEIKTTASVDLDEFPKLLNASHW